MAKQKIKEKPAWLKTESKELESIILKLAKQGLTSEKIGLVLRDQYGIPKAKLLGKSISQILKENNMYKDADMTNLETKQQKIQKHLGKNKQDKRAKLGLTIISARISKLKKHNNKKKK